MVIVQGDIFWADLREPRGSGAGFERPVVIVQGNEFNRSRLGTVVCVPLTSNLKWADAPGNVVLGAAVTGLPKDSVANVSLILAVDRGILTTRAGHLPAALLGQVLAGIGQVLALEEPVDEAEGGPGTAATGRPRRRFGRRPGRRR